jgi:hypothetical protein
MLYPSIFSIFLDLKNMDSKPASRTIQFPHIFTYFLEDRRVGGLSAGLIAVNVLLALLHIPGWPCPIKTVLGIPCPGCGLSSAIALLLKGDFPAAFSTHAFAPVVLLLIFAILLVNVLPSPARNRIVLISRQVEAKTGFGVWGLVGLFLYWGLRLSRLL